VLLPSTNSLEALVLSCGPAGINRELPHRRKVQISIRDEQQRLVHAKVGEVVIAAAA
jgi:hypothetical protein